MIFMKLIKFHEVKLFNSIFLPFKFMYTSLSLLFNCGYYFESKTIFSPTYTKKKKFYRYFNSVQWHAVFFDFFDFFVENLCFSYELYFIGAKAIFVLRRQEKKIIWNYPTLCRIILGVTPNCFFYSVCKNNWGNLHTNFQIVQKIAYYIDDDDKVSKIVPSNNLWKKKTIKDTIQWTVEFKKWKAMNDGNEWDTGQVLE